MTQELLTRCFLCGTVHKYATGVTAKGATATEPQVKDGDASLCINCGAWGIFDSTRPDGMRAPTDQESRELARDPVAQKVVEAWSAARSKRH
jgi:hypothetical protein